MGNSSSTSSSTQPDALQTALEELALEEGTVTDIYNKLSDGIKVDTVTTTIDGKTTSETPNFVILFIRHGFSCANFIKQEKTGGGIRQGIKAFGGFPSSPLNKIGIEQASAFGSALSSLEHTPLSFRFSPEFYSSNLPRAIETAFYIQQKISETAKTIIPINHVKESGSGGENTSKSLAYYRKHYPQIDDLVETGGVKIESPDYKGVPDAIIPDKFGGWDDGTAGAPRTDIFNFSGATPADKRRAFISNFITYWKSVHPALAKAPGGPIIIPIVSHGSTMKKFFTDGEKLGNLGAVAINVSCGDDCEGVPEDLVRAKAKVAVAEDLVRENNDKRYRAKLDGKTVLFTNNAPGKLKTAKKELKTACDQLDYCAAPRVIYKGFDKKDGSRLLKKIGGLTADGKCRHPPPTTVPAHQFVSRKRSNKKSRKSKRSRKK